MPAHRLPPSAVRLVRLVAAAACLAVAAVSFMTGGRPASPPSTKAVLVASRDLPVGRVLSRADVRTVRYPASAVVAGLPHDMTSVLGRRLAGAVRAGEPLVDVQFLGRDLTTALARSTVAMQVAVSGAHTTDLLHAGDRVDLLGTPAEQDWLTGTDAAGPSTAPATDAPATDSPATGEAAAGSTTDPSDDRSRVTTVVRAVRLLAVLPGTDSAGNAGAELVVAVSRADAMRIATAAGSRVLSAVGDRP